MCGLLLCDVTKVRDVATAVSAGYARLLYNTQQAVNTVYARSVAAGRKHMAKTHGLAQTILWSALIFPRANQRRFCDHHTMVCKSSPAISRVYILPTLLLSPAAGARKMLQRLRGLRQLQGVPGGGPVGPCVGRAGGPVRAAARGCHTRANPHELASNKECIQTCCCRACWNDTGITRNRAS